jgi:mannitol-specific phosphotransferase system IIBC component
MKTLKKINPEIEKSTTLKIEILKSVTDSFDFSTSLSISRLLLRREKKSETKKTKHQNKKNKKKKKKKKNKKKKLI